MATADSTGTDGDVQEQLARGLPGDWLNGWLAAVGVTVLVPEARLAWTPTDPPQARFTLPPGPGLGRLIADRLPAVEDLDRLVIADLPQNIEREQYRAAATRARAGGEQGRSLAVLVTDAASERQNARTLPSVPFNVGAPRGETLFTRLRACAQRVHGNGLSAASVQATLEGRGVRHEVNGLGFDYRRIAASIPGEGRKWVDPLVECLVFQGLLLHPVHGDGTYNRQRGWWGPSSQPYTFCWPVWTDALDRSAVDALLDVVYGDVARRFRYRPGAAGRGEITIGPRWRLRSVTAVYGSVPFRGVGSNDPTRGYGSRRLA